MSLKKRKNCGKILQRVGGLKKNTNFVNFKSQEDACLNFSNMSELKISLRPDLRKKNKNTKYVPFHCNYALFNKKARRKTLYMASHYKYDSSDVYPRGLQLSICSQFQKV